jgi:hypothetical protein
MLAIRIISWTARIVGTLALLLGLIIWAMAIFAPQFELDLRPYHMIFGFLLTLTLLVTCLVAFFVKGLWPAALFGLVYTAFLPYFGLNQMFWLIGGLHWLIQLAHLIVGIGAVAFMQFVTARFESSYKVAQAETQTAG